MKSPSNVDMTAIIRYDTIRYDTIRYDTIRYDTIRGFEPAGARLSGGEFISGVEVHQTGLRSTRVLPASSSQSTLFRRMLTLTSLLQLQVKHPFLFVHST